MIKNKSIVFIMLFFVGIVFTNEMYIKYLSYIDSNYYYVSFYPQYGQEEEMLKDIEQAAGEHNLQVFFVTEETKSSRNQKFNIYASDGVREYLEKEEQIFENKQGSLFSGSVTVEYAQYYALDAETIHKYPEGFRLIGEYEDMYRFKQMLIDEYAGGFPHFEGYNSLEDIQGMVLMVWAVVILVIMLIEYYFITVERKEIFVRYTMGEALLDILRNCILRDGMLLVAVAIVLTILNYLICGGVFEIKTIILATGIIILLIMACYLKLMWYDVSEVFSNKKISSETIMANYAVKAIVLVLVVSMASANVVAITRWLQYGTQKELFDYYKKDYYVSFYHRDDLCENCDVMGDVEETAGFFEEDKLVYALYVQNEKAGKATVTYTYGNAYDMGVSNADKNAAMVYISCNGEEYLKKQLTEYTEYKENALYVIAPQYMQCSDEEQEMLFDWFSDDVGMNADKYERIFLEYNEDIELTALDGESEVGSTIQSNPIILFESIKNKDVPTIREMENYSICGFHTSTFIETSEEDIDGFLEENQMCDGVRYYMNSVWEDYNGNLMSLKRFAIISIAIIIMMLSLFVFVNQTFLKMLYNGNGIELAIKKVSGYSMLERFKIIILADCITGMVAVSVACVVCGVLGLCNLLYVVLIGVLCIVMDIALIICNSLKMDKEHIQKILKGGCL